MTSLHSVNTAYSLFQQPWWLDAVAPGQWGEAVVEENGEVVARLPYAWRRFFGLFVIRPPMLTPHMGPWIKPSEGKQSSTLAREKELLFALIDQLPHSVCCSIKCHPCLANVLPFYWRGFELYLRYTYRLDLGYAPDTLWQGVKGSVRTDVRKAQKILEVRRDLGLEAFFKVNAMTFARQNMRPPYSFEYLQVLDNAIQQRGQREIFFAVDSRDRIHAANYLVWDAEAAYHLMGGANPELRGSGAQVLIAWHEIKFASTVTKQFDFEGSMIESVERSFRGFGAKQVPYYCPSRVHPAFRAGMLMRDWLKR